VARRSPATAALPIAVNVDICVKEGTLISDGQPYIDSQMGSMHGSFVAGNGIGLRACAARLESDPFLSPGAVRVG